MWIKNPVNNDNDLRAYLSFLDSEGAVMHTGTPAEGQTHRIVFKHANAAAKKITMGIETHGANEHGYHTILLTVQEARNFVDALNGVIAVGAEVEEKMRNILE